MEELPLSKILFPPENKKTFLHNKYYYIEWELWNYLPDFKSQSQKKKNISTHYHTY